MAKLSIDIGVNLGTAIRDLGTLKMAFDTLSQSVDNYSSKISALKTNLGQLKSTSVNVNVNQNVGAVTAPKMAPVPDIFAEYRSGASSAATVSEFLKNKQEELSAKITRLKQIASNVTSLKLYEEAQRRIADAQQQLNQLNVKAEGGFNRLSRATGQANTVLINVGRLAQDSAYGILGISNNINPLVESWSQLNAEAKKTPNGSVWKELGKALSGPGGLALGFSAVTAALSFAAVGLQYWTKNTSKAKDENEKFNDSLNKAKEKATLTGIQLQQLLSSAGNSSVGLDVQRQSLNKLNGELEKYNIVLTEADVKNGNAKEAIDALTLALVQQAVVQQNSERLAKLFVERQRVISDIKTAQEDLTKAEEKYGKAVEANSEYSDAVFQYNPITDAENSVRHLNEKYNDLNDSIQDVQRIIQDTTSDIVKYFNLASQKVPTGKIKELEDRIVELKNAQRALKDPLGEDFKINQSYKKQVEDLQNQLDEILGKKRNLGGLTEAPKTFQQVVQEISRDLNAISNRNYETFDEKQLAIIGRIKEGLKFIYDVDPNTKLGKKFVDDLNNDLKQGPLSTIKLFNYLLSNAKITLFGSQQENEFSKLQEKLQSISENADILDTEKLSQQISAVEAYIVNANEAKRVFNKEKFDDSSASLLKSTLSNLSVFIVSAQKQLKQLKEQKIDIDIDTLIKNLEKGNRKIEANYRASLQRLKQGDSYAAILEAKLKEDEDLLQNTMTALGESIAKRFNPFDPRNIMLAGKIKKLNKEIEKDVKDIKLAKLKDQLANEFDEAITGATQGLLEGIGNILGGANVKDVFGGIFGPLMESLGKSLIKFALLTEKVQATIKKLRENLIGPNATIAVGAAIALGIALIAGGKLLAKASSKGFAKGGFVSGDGHGTSDSIPARLSNGEYVVRANSVGKYGVGFLDAINNGTFKKFANGGLASLTMPRFVTTNPGSLVGKTSMANMGSMVVGETVIRGQDLKLVLSRADNRFNNTTSR